MSHRMEIELTSRREDGAFTWRTVGARQPKGVIDAAVAGAAAKVGDVLRIEANIELDGITIVGVIPQKVKASVGNRIEIIAPKMPAPGVTTSLVEKSARRSSRSGGDRFGDDRSRSGRPDRARRPPSDARTNRDGTSAPRGGAAPSTRRSSLGEGRTHEGRTGAPSREGAPSRPSPPRGRVRPPRLVERTAHRDALFDTLPPEQRPIAEQLAIGGLPAVRRALAEEQTAAKAAGRPPVAEEGIVLIAEQLLKPVREAVWLDRAEAAVAQLDSISLRDLRATVVGAAPRDDAGRELLNQLRTAHDDRLLKLRTSWAEEIQKSIDEGRVLQALRLSGRLPEPSARFPAGLVEPLAAAASAALNAETPPDRWIALLEASSASPVRRMIKPVGLPTGDAASVRQAASAAAGKIPALASLLGLSMPPPPGPPGARPPAPRKVQRAHGPNPRARIPPPPPRPAVDAAEETRGTTAATVETEPNEIELDPSSHDRSVEGAARQENVDEVSIIDAVVPDVLAEADLSNPGSPEGVVVEEAITVDESEPGAVSIDGALETAASSDDHASRDSRLIEEPPTLIEEPPTE